MGAGAGAWEGAGGGREKGGGRAKDSGSTGAERLLVNKRPDGAGYDTCEGVGPVGGNLIDISDVTPDGRTGGV